MPFNKRNHGFRAEGRVAEREVRPRTVDGFEVPVVRNPAHDAEIRLEPPAVDREVHVYGIIVRGKEHRRCVREPRIHQGLAVAGIPDKDSIRDDAHQTPLRLRVALEHVNDDALAFKRSGGGASDGTSPDDQRGCLGAGLGLE